MATAPKCQSVKPPAVTYTPRLPQSLLCGDKGKDRPDWFAHGEGALSAAQLEALVYAGQRHAMHNKDDCRSGFFIGDGTGVGK